MINTEVSFEVLLFATYSLYTVVSTMSRSHLLRLIILGAPGSGKGTISNRIVRDFGLGYFSVGDCLRENIKRKTDLGAEAERYIKTGTLVPDLLINQLVISELRRSFISRSWLLDGYPRSRGQANELWSHKDVRPNRVLYLNVPDSEIIERIKHRWIHPGSARIYHNIYNPPKVAGVDDVTGEKLVQREDDKEEVVKARLKAFHAQNSEIVGLYK